VLSCSELPPSGVGGGYPGSGSSCFVVRADDAAKMPGPHTAAAAQSVLRDLEPISSKVGHLQVNRGDSVIVVAGGGAGLGDPLLRPAQVVADDVRAGYITAPHAWAAYGVVVDENGGHDHLRTAERREQIRNERVGAEPRAKLQAPASPGVAVVVAEGFWRCGSCGECLGECATNWRESAVLREHPIEERLAALHMYVRPRQVDPAVVMREYFCPACAQSLVVDVVTSRTPTLRAPVLAGAGVRPHAERSA